MSDREIEPILLPDECITITPIRDGLQFAYQRSPDGTDLIAVITTDARVGTVRELLTVDGARLTAAILAAMVDDLDTLRREWDNRKDNDDD